MNRNVAWVIGIIGLALVVVIVVLAVVKPGAVPAPIVQTPSQTSADTNPVTPSPAVKQPGMPAAVTSSTVSTSDTTAVVRGSVTPNGAFTNYWYEYGATPNLGIKTSNQAIGSGYSLTSAPGYITGLTKDTTYYYRIVAQNQYGTVMGSTVSLQTTHGTPAPVGSAPGTKTVGATGITRTDAVLNGQVVPGRVQTTYWFEYGTTGNLGNTTEFVSAGDGSAQVSASIPLSGLIPATQYYFRLDAQNQFGTVQGVILNFKTLGPAAASIPTVSTKNATAVRGTTASLHGSVSSNGDATTYWFEYGTDSVVGNILTNSTDRKSAGNGTVQVSVQADIANLSLNTNYYYQLVAQNSFGVVRGDRMTFKTSTR